MVRRVFSGAMAVALVATALVAVMLMSVPYTSAKPGQTKACNGCHAYPPSFIDVSATPTSIEVNPGASFTVDISWLGGATDGTINEVNWPTDFSSVPESRDNVLFNPSPRIPYSGTAPSGTTLSTLTAPDTPGTYTVRVHVAVGSWSSASKETDYQDIVVTVAEAANQPPVADANGPYSGEMGQPISFDGTGSYDSDGTIVSYEWDFGDGSTGTGPTPTYTYSTAGTYTVTLTVTDDDGATGTDTTTAMISEPAPPTAGPADLVRKSAWPEHHHFSLSKDEDGVQTLYGKVKNVGTVDTAVEVRFDISDANTGADVIDLVTSVATLMPEEITDLSVGWSAPLIGKYNVSAQCWYDSDGDDIPDTPGEKVKTFSFAVVE